MKLKDLLKSVLPAGVVRRMQLVNGALSNRRVKTFQEIYKSNHWKGTDSRSGPGSSLEQTETIRRELPLLFQRHGVRSVLDIPCGDFNWMSRVDLSGITYIGADLVDDLIVSNNGKFSRPGISFQVMDMRRGPLPKVDLIFCRDCLVHMSYNDIWSSLKTIVDSGSTYLLTTSFANRPANRNIATGNWRPLNLEVVPFNLVATVEKINENCTEGNMAFTDKVLLLVRVVDLKTIIEQIELKLGK